jgi:hypothetical protein
MYSLSVTSFVTVSLPCKDVVRTQAVPLGTVRLNLVLSPGGHTAEPGSRYAVSLPEPGSPALFVDFPVPVSR